MSPVERRPSARKELRGSETASESSYECNDRLSVIVRVEVNMAGSMEVCVVELGYHQTRWPGGRCIEAGWLVAAAVVA